MTSALQNPSGRMLTVKEVFATVQGEGSRTGQPAVFVRFSGCNLWNGLETGRKSASGHCGAWCDTDFVGGTKETAGSLLSRIVEAATSANMARPLVVFTGGEPLLQATSNPVEFAAVLVECLSLGWETALETNGTVAMPPAVAAHWSHVTVSPKGSRLAPGSVAHLKPLQTTDLKIVVPCPMPVEQLAETYQGAILYFQPCDIAGENNTPAAIALANKHGGRLSVQTHKILGLP